MAAIGRRVGGVFAALALLAALAASCDPPDYQGSPSRWAAGVEVPPP